MDADELVRVLGLTETFSGDTALARETAALTAVLDGEAAGLPAAEAQSGDPGDPGRGLAIGLGLSAILWMMLLGGAYAVIR